MKKILYILIILIFAFGIYGASDLVIGEINQGNVCPKILGIPACYIIMACFVIPLLIHVANKLTSWYFTFTSLAFSIAAFASYYQYNGLAECPKAANGTPMCYYSLAIFTSLIVLRMIYNRLK